MSQLIERITINPKQCGGRPCIRGMRIRVSDVLDLFAAGLSADEILTEMPDLEADDLKAALSYASHKLELETLNYMNLLDKDGYNLHKLNKINIILGKNGCGKSTLMRQVEKTLANEKRGYTKYITPERGGSLKYSPNLEVNSENPAFLDNLRRKNQFPEFKQQSLLEFRTLEILFSREMDKNPSIRCDLNHTFENIVINPINELLDNIQIKGKGKDFKIYKKDSQQEIKSDEISSGESELISLAIECMVFDKECVQDQENILFLDEPDVHLHPDLQARLANFLRQLVEKNNFRVILATHSTSFLGAFQDYDDLSIEFMTFEQTDLFFEPVSEVYKRILPIFGAHPLSNIFNEAPILLVEGEDDERVWQQAIRTSKGKIKVFPCSVDTISELHNYEIEVSKVLQSIYDNATAFSLRDRDDSNESIEDILPVIRMKLSCRAAENLLLSDDVLKRLGIDWNTMILRMNEWITKHPKHQNYQDMLSFQQEDYQRKVFNLKKIRNDLMGIIGSHKSWEIAVGQTIGSLNISDKCEENSLQNYLGEKVVKHLLKNV